MYCISRRHVCVGEIQPRWYMEVIMYSTFFAFARFNLIEYHVTSVSAITTSLNIVFCTYFCIVFCVLKDNYHIQYKVLLIHDTYNCH